MYNILHYYANNNREFHWWAEGGYSLIMRVVTVWGGFAVSHDDAWCVVRGAWCSLSRSLSLSL